MDKEIDYSAMEEAFAKIKPFTVQSVPSTAERNDYDVAVKPLVRLYKLYREIKIVLDRLSALTENKDLILLASHLVKSINSNIIEILDLSVYPEVETPKNLTNYTQSVRKLLLLSASACSSATEYMREIRYIDAKLRYREMLTLHSILLTFTAF